jgi:hypothetical protein
MIPAMRAIVCGARTIQTMGRAGAHSFERHVLRHTPYASITIFGAALPARPAIWSRTRAAMSR